MSDTRQKDIIQLSIMPTPTGGSAVGMRDREWFVAIVKNNTEQHCKERLVKRGCEAYIPTQTTTILDSRGHRKIIDRVLLPAKVLIFATEAERRTIIELPYIIRYMTDRAKAPDKYGRHPIATIPKEQIEKLKFVLFNSDQPVEFDPLVVKEGDEVRVIRGKLMGLTGFVTDIKEGLVNLCMDFGPLGTAKVTIDAFNIEKSEKSMQDSRQNEGN